MKKIVTLFLFFVICQLSLAQNYPMTSANNGDTFTTCSGTFTDDGANGNYGNNINDRTITFCPADAGDLLKFNFTSFNTEDDYDTLDVFYGTDTTGNPAQTFTGNLGAFTFFSAIPGDCVTFRFNSDTSLNYSGWSATISCVTPCAPPTAALVDDSTIDICSSEAVNAGDLTVDFDASNSYSNDSYSIVSYEWNWGDGTTSVTSTPITSHTFPDDPGYYVVSLKVRTNNTETDEDGCLSSNIVVRFIRVLPPPNFDGTTEGPIDVSCGDTVDLTGIASSQIISQDPPLGSGSDVVLPDTQNYPFDSTIDLTGFFPAGATVTAECLPEVIFNIEHSFAGDLKIFLIAPSGEEVILMNGYGDSTSDPDNFGGTKLGYCVNGGEGDGPGCFAPYHIVNSGGIIWNTAASFTTYTQSCDTYTGTCESGDYFLQDETYNSSESMTNLVGAELNGVWTLRIIDYWAIDDGYLDGWSISFPGDCYTDLETETPILSGGLWSGDGTGPVVPEPQVVNNNPFLPTTIDPCPGDADCTGNQLENTVTIGPFVNAGSYTYTFTVEDEFGCEFIKEVVINVDCPCSLILTSAPETAGQAICFGESIADITYEAGGNATDVVVTGLPAGVTGTFLSGIFTISGTPTETGTFNYTVTTVGCEFNIPLEGTITVNPQPVVTSITQPLEFCTSSTTTYDFDLTQVEGELVPNPTDYDITYYTSQINAETPTSPISNPEAYPVSATSPTIIYIRVEDLLTGCFTITSITVQPGEGVQLTPVVNPIEVCDEDFNGIYEYDLTLLNDLVLSPNTGYNFIYYATQTDVGYDNPIPSNQWNNYSLNGMPNSIWILAESAEGCRSDAIEINFDEGQGISLLSNPYEISFCEGTSVNLADHEGDITNESGVTFTYYETVTNAQNETNPITNYTAYESDEDGTMYVRLEKSDRCTVIAEIEYEVLLSPSIEDLPSELVLCEGQETIELEVSSDDPSATFEWTWGNNQTTTGSNIIISETGTYFLTVTGSNTCITTEELLVRPGGMPIIVSIESGDNYLIVFAESGNGGMLEYSLNGVIWQDNPRFDNLIKGETYTVYVREDGCEVSSHQAVVLNIANFISPNGDGYNDVWEVRGIQVTPDATIRIFDRYGKIFIDTNFDGNFVWDGKYLGRPLPSGDYWYIMEVPSDGVVAAHKFMGHISIRNQ